MRAHSTKSRENEVIAGMLIEAADLLRVQRANPFRVAAYRKAADTLYHLSTPVRQLFETDGREVLQQLPGIGRGLASSIAEILLTGGWSQIDRLRGVADPEALLQNVRGIGPELARKLHDTMHIDTLEGLELACRDGRLATVRGIGPRRAAAITAALTALLDRRRANRRSRPTFVAPQEPTVAMLLDIDRHYREKAAADELPKIAPRRFNPKGKEWLPILHTRRGQWNFTALYSNTARAHELRRVVRGREAESAAYYASEAFRGGMREPLLNSAVIGA